MCWAVKHWAWKLSSPRRMILCRSTSWVLMDFIRTEDSYVYDAGLPLCILLQHNSQHCFSQRSSFISTGVVPQHQSQPLENPTHWSLMQTVNPFLENSRWYLLWSRSFIEPPNYESDWHVLKVTCSQDKVKRLYANIPNNELWFQE